MSLSIELHQQREWIAGIQAGQLDVYQAVFDTYATRLRQFSCVWVPYDVAEDIVQDVLFDIWRRRASLHVPNGNLTAYLFGAVRNGTAMHLRHERVVSRVLHHDPHTGAPGLGMQPVTPDDQVTLDAFHADLAEAVAQLSELQRAVLILRWTQGLSYADIGIALSMSENAARHHMSRSRQLLRPLLARYFSDLP